MFATLSVAAVCLAQEPVNPQPAAQTAGVPRLEVSTNVWDFGEKWAGEKAETVITLTNVGDAPLKIDKVKSSCGCTVAKVTKKLLQPGESEGVKVTYSTKKRTAKVTQKIRVHTNDPANPVTVIEVKGRVRQLVELSDARGLNFGAIGRDDVVTKSIEIECAYSEPLVLALGALQSDKFDVQLEEVEAGKLYRLTATTTPPLRDGPFRVNAKLLTGTELIPEVTVSIRGKVQAPVAVSPPSLFVSGKMQRSSQRTLRVTSRRKVPLQVTGVTVSDPAISVEILPTSAAPARVLPASNVTTIRVKLPPVDEIPADGATITITTDDEQYGEFVVPVRKRAVPKKPAAAAKWFKAEPKPRVSEPPKKDQP